MKININEMKATLNNFSEVAAAYIFGSSVDGSSVVNDIDILVLLYPNADIGSIDLGLSDQLAGISGVSADKIDIVVFDLKLTDPKIIYKAVNTGIILKNESPDFLGDNIEKLSQYFLENEFLLHENEIMRREIREEFCAD